ncbi:MAG: hypothetical protein H7144_12795 [Burkholderiales bacterium]|nr:hypothetical protein [Phycisphaerae bacterium]
MTKHELEEHLNREPFQPFRVNTADGKSVEIRNPRMVVPTETRLFIVAANDSWHYIVLRQVTSIESLQAA